MPEVENAQAQGGQQEEESVYQKGMAIVKVRRLKFYSFKNSSSDRKYILQQMFMIWAIMQIGMHMMSWLYASDSEPPSATKILAPQSAKDVSSNTADQKDGRPVVDPHLVPPVDAETYWPAGVNMDMHIYLTTLPRADADTKWTTMDRKQQNEGLPHFVWKNITYGNYNDHRVANFEVKFPEVMEDICRNL